MPKRMLGILVMVGLATEQAAFADSPFAEGHFTMSKVASPILVAAPHGGFDRFSDDFAREVALMTGASYLLADGFRTTDHPWNVNRPTEGVKLKAHEEPITAAASEVYAAYSKQVSAYAPRMYVEIHGNSRPESAGWIEMATDHLAAEDAVWFKADFESHVAAMPAGIRRFGLKIEPLDLLHYQASSVKQQGVFRLVPMALHFETPWAMRADEATRHRYAAAIAGSLDRLQTRLSSK